MSIDVIKLIESQNRCLKRFVTDSQQFIASANRGDLSELYQLQEKRDSIIKALQLYDRKISREVLNLNSKAKTPEFIQTVKELCQQKENLIQSILALDSKIISLIEEEKLRLMKEVSEFEKRTNLTKKFKSTWVSESGEKLDGKL